MGLQPVLEPAAPLFDMAIWMDWAWGSNAPRNDMNRMHQGSLFSGSQPIIDVGFPQVLSPTHRSHGTTDPTRAPSPHPPHPFTKDTPPPGASHSRR